MSETELHKGKITLLASKDDSKFEGLLWHILVEKFQKNNKTIEFIKKDMTDWDMTLEEYFRDNIWEDDGYVLIKSKLYKVDDTELEYGDLTLATKDPDGSISYVLSYYNGGCCFTEALEEALEKLK